MPFEDGSTRNGRKGGQGPVLQPQSTTSLFPCSLLRLSASLLEDGTGQVTESFPLSPLGVEIGGIEPAPEGPIELGPFLVDHGVPGGVAAAALVDARLAEEAFVGEAEALRRGTRRRIQRVALPFVAPVAQLESALHHQVHRL